LKITVVLSDTETFTDGESVGEQNI